MQGHAALAVCQRNAGIHNQQQPDGVPIALVGCPMQGRAAIQVDGVHVSAPAQRHMIQEGCLAVLRRHVADCVAAAKDPGSAAVEGCAAEYSAKQCARAMD